jgi:hypothetical protein
MASQGDPLSKRVERVQEIVRQLPAAATTINIATDQLGGKHYAACSFQPFCFSGVVRIPGHATTALFHRAL